MRLLTKIVRKALLVVYGKASIKRKIVATANLLNIDLIELGYNNAGILNYQDYVVSGEQYLLGNVLPLVIPAHGGVVFDIGANVGDISMRIAKAFPDAAIWAFEPNPVTFDLLQKNLTSKMDAVHSVNAGLGAEEGQGILHCYESDQSSGHASVYRDVFGLYKNYGIDAADKLRTFAFDVTTIDDVCRGNGIARIDFAKIDVEGHELNVLKGATELLKTGGLQALQFEFTDCNVMSRVFLRDFYAILPGFEFFRLHRDGLINLGNYATRHEIFQFQNILALTSSLAARLKADGRVRFL